MQDAKTPLQNRDLEKIGVSTSILKRFLTFLPQNIVRKILINPDGKVLDKSEWIEGAIIFSDISGFTPMSQALSNYGSRGIEEMSRILNTYLSKMSNIIYKNDGILQKIAGDSLTVLFEKPANVEWKVPILNAIECSFEMQKFISQFRKIKTIAGEFSLTMKIGISSGRLFIGTLGSYDFGIEVSLIGEPINKAVVSEHHAKQGEIWIEKESIEIIKDYVKIITNKNNYFRIRLKNIIKPDEKKLKEVFSVKLRPEEKQTIIKEIRACIPSSIAKRLELGYQEFLGEHRKTTILFINFEGLDLKHKNFEKNLKLYYITMQKIITQYRGTLYEFESGDKGSKIIALFGSPLSTEDNEGLAILCALAILKAGNDIEWIKFQKIGISTGYAFAGVIGTALLRRYALIGDKVNLAARLMTSAENNTILIDDDTYNRTSDRFLWKKMSPRKLKGTSGLITTYLFDGIKKEKPKEPLKEIAYLLGRDEEAKRFAKIFDKLKDSLGQIISVIGEMGIGKGVLIKEFIKFVGRKGLQHHEAYCYSYGTQIPYFGWIKIFNNIFDIKEDDKNDLKLKKVSDKLNALSPKNIKKLPLIAKWLGLEAEETEWSKHLDTAVRKSNLLDVLSEILIQLSREKALFIILYDIQWSNSSTLEFLLTLAKNIVNEKIMLIYSYQPFIIQIPDAIQEVKKLEYYNSMVLNELSSEQSIDFIKLKWNVSNIPDEFENIIKRSVGGNPYYIETLITSLINTNQLLFDKDKNTYSFSQEALQQLKVPPTLEDLIVNQIDKLDETSKLLLKVASVIGMDFNTEILKWIFPIRIQKQELLLKLSKLCETGLLEKEEKKAKIHFSFRNELTLDTVYKNLPFSQRKHLHESTASTIENIYGDKIESFYEILAFHYKFTDNINKQLLYLKLAGNKAKNNYANNESIKYYEQLTEILNKKLKANIDFTTKEWGYICRELFDTYVILGDITRFMGEMKKSKIWLDKSRAESVKIADEERRYTLLKSIGEWYEFGDQYQDALAYYSRAYICISKLNDKNKMSLSSGHMGNVYRIMGYNDLALKRYKESATLANECGNIMMEGRWLGNIGIIYANQGNYDKALEYYFKALDISKKENDKSRAAAWYSLIATVYLAQAKYDDAIKYGNESLSVAEAIGYKRSMVLTLNTIGNTYRFLGQYDEALKSHSRALEIANKIKAINQEVICMGEIGEIYRFQGKYDEALTSYKKAYSIAKSLGDKYNQALWERAIGIIYYQSPNPQVKKAKQHLRNAMETATLIGHKKLSAETQIHLGNAVAVDGEFDEAVKIIRKGLKLAQHIQHPGLIVWGKRMFGILLIKMGKKEEGKNLLLYALKENEKLNLKKDIAECCLELGRALIDKKYLLKALKLFKELNLNPRVEEVEEYISTIH